MRASTANSPIGTVALKTRTTLCQSLCDGYEVRVYICALHLATGVGLFLTEGEVRALTAK